MESGMPDCGFGRCDGDHKNAFFYTAYRPVVYRAALAFGSSRPQPPSPPAEKATARQDQAGKASTPDGESGKVLRAYSLWS